MDLSFGSLFIQVVISVGIYALFRWAKNLRDN